MEINSGTDLRAAIMQLEIRQAAEGKILRENFHLAYESIKPINLIKNTLRNITESKDLTDHILSAGVGLATGQIVKMVFEEESDSPLKKLFSTALQFGVTTIIARHPETVQAISTGITAIITSLSEAGESDENETETNN